LRVLLAHVHHKVVGQRLPAEDDAEAHAGAVGHGQADALAHRPEADVGLDQRPLLVHAARVADDHHPQHRRLDHAQLAQVSVQQRQPQADAQAHALRVI